MKNGIFISIVAYYLVLTTVFIRNNIMAGYEYENKIGSNWELADKSSDLKAKSQYVDKFVTALKQQGLEGTYNAMYLKTPNNSFDANMQALETLSKRLKEIQGMDPNSLAYQQAIAQITGQEQGQAERMIGTLYGCWLIKNHFWVWGTVNIWLTSLVILAGIGLLCTALCREWTDHRW